MLRAKLLLLILSACIRALLHYMHAGICTIQDLWVFRERARVFEDFAAKNEPLSSDGDSGFLFDLLFRFDDPLREQNVKVRNVACVFFISK